MSLMNSQTLTFEEKSGVYSIPIRGIGFEEPAGTQWTPFARQATVP